MTTSLEPPEFHDSRQDLAPQSDEMQPRRSFLFGAAAVAGSFFAAPGRGSTPWLEQVRSDRERPPALDVASPSSGVSRAPLGRGVVTRGASIDLHQDLDAVIDSVSIAAGGATGWHRHPGPEFVLVTKGTLTFRRSDGVKCITETVSAGQAFVGAGAGELHAAHNAGSEPVDFVVTFFNVPTGSPPRTDADPPAAC